MHLTCLLGDGHILVDYSDTTLAGDGNGQCRLGHGVHGSRNEGYVKCDVAGEAGGEIDFAGKYV